MSAQHEGLLIADRLVNLHAYPLSIKAAVELRRLVSLNKELLGALKMAVSALERSDYIRMDCDSVDVVDASRDLIDRAEGCV